MEKLSDGSLINAIKAASIHKKVGKYIRDTIHPGILLKDIAILIENKIKEEIIFDTNNKLDRGIAFPVGLSINNCAAHYTPNYNEEPITLKIDDIIKIDYGVHVKGTIIDSAFTMCFNEKYNEFINISKDVTNYAVSQCGPDAVLGDIGTSIEEYVKSIEIDIDNKHYKLQTMRDLSGHMIAKYEIHAGKAVPNISINYPLRMEENEYYAIEPFITTGKGDSIIKEPNSHYMLVINHNMIGASLNKNENIEYNIIKENYGTLPFCQRWLYELDNKIDHNNFLKRLHAKKLLNEYPPLYDIKDSIISQFEHSIFIKNNGIINLTKNDYY